MKTLNEIKNEVACKVQGYDSWDFMAKNDPICLQDRCMVDEVAKRYATEAIKADRERVAQNAKTKYVRYDDPKANFHGEDVVDKESILNLPIELK